MCSPHSLKWPLSLHVNDRRYITEGRNDQSTPTELSTLTQERERERKFVFKLINALVLTFYFGHVIQLAIALLNFLCVLKFSSCKEQALTRLGTEWFNLSNLRQLDKMRSVKSYFIYRFLLYIFTWMLYL